jgi:hypothetical protein
MNLLYLYINTISNKIYKMSAQLANKIEQSEPIEYGKTYTHVIDGFGFGNLQSSTIIEIYKDGRPFSHFIEPWLAINYPSLVHVKGCKKYDHTDIADENIKYDQKTFTSGGCKFMPSNMIGEGRTFNKEIFEEKAKKLIYIIVSNCNFPEIKIKFVRGIDLIIDYPKGVIPLKDLDKFFN